MHQAATGRCSRNRNLQTTRVKNLVLVELDFPRRKQLSDMIRHQNEEMAEQYQIQGFPTIIILNSDGQKVAELGYTPGGPNAFIAELEKLRKG